MRVPSVYAAGYEKARLIDPVLAGSYVALTRVGDPPVDAVMSDLEPPGQKEAVRLLGGAIEQNEEVLRDAPASLQHLIHEVTRVPVWYDRQAAQCGCRAFFKLRRHSGGLPRWRDRGRLLHDDQQVFCHHGAGHRQRRPAVETERPAPPEHIHAAGRRAVRGRLEALAPQQDGTCAGPLAVQERGGMGPRRLG